MTDERVLKSGIDGFDKLTGPRGIFQGSSILISGGCGTGKTIFCLQNIYGGLINGEKALYLSFEEAEDRLRRHMRNFGWNPEKYEKEGKLIIKKLTPYKVSRAVEGMLAMGRGEVTIDIRTIFGLVLEEFKPDRIVFDSLSSLLAAFSGRQEEYRLYLEELFDYLTGINTTSYLISEMEQSWGRYSRAGVEEFLADGVIVLYNIEYRGERRRAIEILKFRGMDHVRKIVPFEITSRGIVVYPEESVHIQ